MYCWVNIVFRLQQEMFNLLLDLGARLDIKNRQGLTPLTLAATLTRKEVNHSNLMSHHTAEKILFHSQSWKMIFLAHLSGKLI
jgi:ankyrin repeat protein